MTAERILFVDDEPNILAGLQRMLRFMRGQWDMRFVDSGRGALDLLAGESYDAVVTDMRMPGLNGAQLLAQVRKAYPTMVRVVLSGHSEMEDAVVICGAAHHVLSKPCEPQSLVAAIRKGLTLRGLLQDDGLSALVSSLPRMPDAPSAYQQVLAGKNRPGCTFEDIAATVPVDEPLCTMVRAANFFPDALPDCSHATIRMLSQDALSALLVRNGLDGILKRIPPELVAGMREHDLRAARAAHRIAGRDGLGLLDQELAVSAALLGSIGISVLADQRPDLVAGIKTLVAAGQDPAEAEEAILGLRHQSLSAHVLASWEVGWPLVEAVAFSGNPSIGGGGGLDAAGIAHLACCLIGPPPAYGRPGPFVPSRSLDRDYLRLIGREDELGAWIDAVDDDPGA